MSSGEGEGEFSVEPPTLYRSKAWSPPHVSPCTRRVFDCCWSQIAFPTLYEASAGRLYFRVAMPW